MRYWALRFGAAIFVTLVAPCLVGVANTHATDAFSWSSGVLLTATEDAEEYTGLDELGRHDWGGGCTYREVLIGNLATTTNDVCVFQGQGFRYGVLLEPVYFGSYVAYNRSFVISFSNDTRMYKVEDAPTHRILWTPYSSNIVYRAGSVEHNGDDFIVIKNIRSKLVSIINPDLSRGYRLISNPSQLLITNEHGEGTPVGVVAASNNGKWAVAQIYDKGIVRINLRDFTKVWFSDYHPDVGVEGIIPEFAISDDGKHVAVVGSLAEPFMIDLSSGCGKSITVFRHDWTQLNGQDLLEACPERQIRAALEGSASGSLDVARRPSFDRTGNKLLVHITTKSSEVVPSQYKDVSISSSTYYDDNPRLEYLALGDSYSSGEGDTEKDKFGRKYYRTQTDVEGRFMVPEEKCHISTRSYPYLLARDMGLAFGSSKQWETVACSGAEIKKDYDNNRDDYLGQADRQGSPRFAQYVSSADTYQEEGLLNFIPGRTQQLEFVERTLPRVVTITGGGNDVGFGKVIEKCATSKETCDYAITTNGISRVGYDIQKLYVDLVALYSKIHRLSPRTKIYAIGYPQFFSDKNNICNLNVRLDKKERKFVRESVTYLNDVIEAAARTVGVKYVDIENSFNNHVLCGENDSYVNGANFNCTKNIKYWGVLNFFAGTDECQESYHPSYKGHKAIADSIRAQVHGGLYNHSYCSGFRTVCPSSRPTIPTPTSYFGWAMVQSNSSVNAVYATLASTQYLQKNNSSANLDIQASDLQPGSKVRIYMLSEPTELGDYTVDNEGRVNTEIITPLSIPAGYHTLHLEGLTFSGELVDLWQIVTVFGSEGDVDEDGVGDNFDKCLFVSISGVDNDHDGVDDACDLTIESTDQRGEVNIQNKAQHDNVLAAANNNNASSTEQDLEVGSRGGANQSINIVNNRNFTSVNAIGICILAITITSLYFIRRHKKRGHEG